MPGLITFSELHAYSSQQIRHYFGGKALGLYEAHQIGITIPSTWMLSAELHDQFLKTQPPLELKAFQKAATVFIQEHLGHVLQPLEEGSYATRSSCQLEDSAHHSFAGIFETCLNVQKKDLPQAIACVWSSPLQEKAKSYSSTSSLMGILIQPMIEAKYAGICFTKHPSPKTLYDNHSLVIEYAPTSGEKVVQGEVIPFRLSGMADVLSFASENEWMNALLKAIFELKKRYHHEADIEFAIDRKDQFYLLQQRPISKVYPSQTLDLSAYKRMYKRSLLSLDIEFLIDGCSRYLSAYLEIPIPLERWMVMITNAQNIQELWVHDILNETVINCLIEKIEHEHFYLSHLKERYADHHHQLIGKDFSPFFDKSKSLETRLFQWFEWITPFLAHYYVPMFVIDALHTSILREIYPVDPSHADHDLFDLGTAGIASLADLLSNALRKLKTCSSFDDCAHELSKIAHKFGFLKCRQVFESPYTPKDLFEMIPEVPDQPQEWDRSSFEEKREKYFHQEHTRHRLDHLREWMRIRNQEMEYILFAFLAARPLIQEVCQALHIEMQDFWRSSTRSLITALKSSSKRLEPTPVAHLTILKTQGQILLSDSLEVRMPSLGAQSGLKGRTVYGTGILEARVQVAFTPEEMIAPSERPCVLVTGMTTPDFVPFIRKHFDALITDEGGILCHAAIVAREIPIPCIVGTGTGSALLSNGAKVRIDFDRAEITETTERIEN